MVAVGLGHDMASPQPENVYTYVEFHSSNYMVIAKRRPDPPISSVKCTTCMGDRDRVMCDHIAHACGQSHNHLQFSN